MIFKGLGTLALACVATVATAVTTTVVDLPSPSGTMRFLDIRPDAASATILVLPGGGGVLNIQNDGTMVGAAAACNPIARNSDLLAARGIGVVLANQPYPGVAGIVDWLEARSSATIWVTGGSSSTAAVATLVNALPPSAPIGAVFLAPEQLPPSLAAAISRPTLVVYHVQDSLAFGPELLANLVSAPDKAGVALSGGVPSDCGYHLFNGLDLAFVNALASFVNAHVVAGLPAPTVPSVEYFNAGFGHYFMTADADEIAGLDGGAFGGAFVRTGWQFNASSTQAAGTVPVCRFFTTPGTFGTKSSHFYTANQAECDGLKLNPNWIYEKIAFYIAIPANGVCPGGTIPVYRMYNHGQTGAPNHRFTTDLATYQQFTTTMGWDQEGIAFCSSP